MADKVEKTAAAVLPLSAENKKKKKQQQQQQARASPLSRRLPAVRDVLVWTLLHAGALPFSCAMGYAYDMLITTIFNNHPPELLLPVPRPMGMTDAEDAVLGALMAGMLWCAAPQAAAAAVALMLPRHRRRLRLFLAYAALVASFAGHGMLAGATLMLGAAYGPGGLGLYFRTFGTAVIFIVLLCDLICFLGLVLHGGEE